MPRLPKPQRPYKNLEAFRRSYFLSKSLGPDAWPCLKCGGKGWSYDWADRCPIEGFKDAPRYKCSCCDGTGEGTREKVKAAYDKSIAEWKQRLEEWKKYDALYKSGLKKLTKEERAALGV